MLKVETQQKFVSRVETYQRALAVFLPGTSTNITSCRAFPDRRTWKPNFKGTGAWLIAATRVNIVYLLEQWPDIHWTDEAAKVRDKLDEHRELIEELIERKSSSVLQVGDYRFGGRFEPYEHQQRAFALSRDTEAYALFMDPGTGKTRVIIDTACYLFGKGDITGVVVVSPNSVKDVWDEEIVLHSPSHYQHDVCVYSSGSGKVARKREDHHVRHSHENQSHLAWLIVNIEALSQATSRSYKLVTMFLKFHKAILVVDESSKIKTPGAKRTRNVVKAGKLARYRRILTGTPSTQGPLDLFSQFKFLDPFVLGFGSFYAFRNHFALMDTQAGYPQLIAYKNLDELKALIDPYSFRVTRDECLDLPDKIYQRRDIELSTEQRRHYKELTEWMRTELHGRDISVINVLTQLLRLQQVVGGFLPAEELDALERSIQGPQMAEKIPGPNPKITALLEVTEELPQRDRVVIWARFRAEIDLIVQELRRCYDADQVVEFHGGRDTEERTIARRKFQDPKSEARFFVAQTETGGFGLTLTEANTVIYFSNSFSLESRIQSEDRCHRVGQTRKVTYIDLVAKNTLDLKVLGALREKKKLADLITGDGWKKWI